MQYRLPVALTAIALLLAACGGRNGSPLPPLGGENGTGVFDAATSQCSVSYDGLIWYTVPAGTFSPIDVRKEQCAATALQARSAPPVPSWAKPDGPTRAIFVATSLQERYKPGGMETLERIASAHHLPMTWMLGDDGSLGPTSLSTQAQADSYNAYHAANGDDLQVEPQLNAIAAAQTFIPWYRPAVSIEPAAPNRVHDLGADMARGEYAFWGITWNSLGTDGIADYGSPWGTYCADSSSFKRPAPDGSCTMLAFEWTARDLTRAYLSGREAAFSTDPDDMQLRGGFTVSAAETYAAQLVDAYAAAGETQSLVMVSQQESDEANDPGDAQIVDALYARAVADGMKTETLTQTATDARTFSAQPRAIAFPYIAGGYAAPSPLLGGVTLYPPTIDYHDAASGMTFVGGHTLPSRVFRYSDYPFSSDALSLPAVPPSQLPALTAVAVTGGTIVFHFVAPVALHYGAALWTDPAALGLSGSGIVPAGRAGAVLVFDLQSGPNDVTFACARCGAPSFPYSQ